MEYGICREGKIIAAFEYEADRDLCLVCFESAYPDCQFDTCAN